MPGPQSSAWLGPMFLAAILLAMGSALLLFPALVWRILHTESTFPLRFVAIVLHLLAWICLAIAAARVPRKGIGRTVSTRTVAVVLLLASVAGFSLGMVSMPMAFPERVGGLVFVYLWERLLLFGYFPYVPSVFAPVVAAHAALFWLVSTLIPNPRAARLTKIGSLTLLLLAVAAFTTQLVGLFFGWAYVLSGATVGGYAFVVAGFRRARRAGGYGWDPSRKNADIGTGPSPATCRESRPTS